MSGNDKDPYLHGLRGGMTPPSGGGPHEYVAWRMGKDQHDQAAKAWSGGNQQSASGTSAPISGTALLIITLLVFAGGWFFWNHITEAAKAAESPPEQLVFSAEMLKAGYVEPAKSELDTVFGCTTSATPLRKGPGLSFDAAGSVPSGTPLSMIFGGQGDLSSEGSPWMFVLSPKFGYVSGQDVQLDTAFDQVEC
ncbi:MAG: hypothetical protein R3C13_14545 [Hyphomonas sp.]